jgi:hypothetical protein
MKYEMTVRVEVRQLEGNYSGGGLNVNESFPFEAADFAAICGVLLRFHDLAEEIKKLQGAKR